MYQHKTILIRDDQYQIVVEGYKYTITATPSRTQELEVEDLQELTSALDTNTVRSLCLECCLFTNQCLLTLVELLKCNCSLTSLDLTKTQIGDEGAVALINALRENYTVTKLPLSEELNEINDRLLEKINTCIDRNVLYKQLMDAEINSSTTLVRRRYISELESLFFEQRRAFRFRGELRSDQKKIMETELRLLAQEKEKFFSHLKSNLEPEQRVEENPLDELLQHSIFSDDQKQEQNPNDTETAEEIECIHMLAGLRNNSSN